MKPMLPDGLSENLNNLVIELISEANHLEGMATDELKASLFDFCAPMNSYYTNLIEGHNTHPIDIDEILKNRESDNVDKRNLQYEARAHIKTWKKIKQKELTFTNGPFDESFIKSIHSDFYRSLPDSFKITTLKNGDLAEVTPGKYREIEVQVANHVAPSSKYLNSFTERFSHVFNDSTKPKVLLTKRIVAVAAAHHRFSWIHPFLDGNGRIGRLLSDSALSFLNLNPSGIWSVSRGLGRNIDEYRTRLSNADLKRYNDYDGRGNLSHKFLIEFIEFFVSTCTDQVKFMKNALKINNLTSNLSRACDLLITRDLIKDYSKSLIINAFSRGSISRTEALKMSNKSDKTFKNEIRKLEKIGLIKTSKKGKEIYYLPSLTIGVSPILFPNLYPFDKDSDLLNYLFKSNS